jgi:flagellar hook protein FlgE
MGITSSLITGLSGLSANQAQLDVVGNNIANANTLAYKASRLDFKSQFSQTFSYGSAPDGDLGGTNPLQVGLGVTPGAVSRNFNDGSREVTGVVSNLAIEGDGFFILKDGQQFYTRDGSFKLNSLNQLVNSDGLYVQGYGVDANFNIVPGVLQSLEIPLGSLTVAQATSNVAVNGGLNAAGILPSVVAEYTLNQPLYESDGAGGVTGTAPTSATLLSDLADSGGAAFFTVGDTISLTGKLGGNTVATKTLDVTAATTLGDLMSFMTGTLGINTTPGANGAVATTPGASFAATSPAGSVTLQLDGNVGTANDLALDTGSLTVTNGTTSTTPFTWNQVTHADGESASTQTVIYDSLGTPVTADMRITLIGKTPAGGTVWQYYATSPDNTPTGAATQTAVGTGTITFDATGRFVSADPTSVTIDRSNTGAQPNLTYNIDFSQLSALTDTNHGSAIYETALDGQKKGTLKTYSIDANGIITGSFDTGANKTLGQVALATFRNNQGLVDKGSNLFSEGPNSGAAVISAPNEFTAGHIVAGALELSNVDLSAEFVKLISASTGFSASSRVITTSNQLLQELLSAAR